MNKKEKQQFKQKEKLSVFQKLKQIKIELQKNLEPDEIL
jgi:hypothetical protein